MPVRNWDGAMNQFTILFEGGVPMEELNSNSLTQNPAHAHDSHALSACSITELSVVSSQLTVSIALARKYSARAM